MNLIDRVKNVLVNPKQEWQVIDGEAASPAGLYQGYIIPLAAIGPVASIIGTSIFGLRLPFAGTFRLPFGVAVWQGVVQYVTALLGVFVLALIIDALAPTFGGQKSLVQALKVAAYSSTAFWAVGIVALVPALGILGLLGLYSLYLLYLGLPVLMKAPREKATAYTVVVVAAAVVVFLVMGAITARFGWRPGITG
jgi:hypothetical protein